MKNGQDDNINYEYITRYIRNSIRPNTGLIKDIEEYAREHDVPVSAPEVMRFIEVLFGIIRPERVLEIGTAVGYSAICMCLSCGCSVVSIELNREMAERARENIEKSGLSDKITVIEGDARDILPELCDEFDIVFVDAAKGQYMEFLPHCIRLLKPGGALISDNVLYKGMTATDELVIRRKITIVKRLRKYIRALCTHPGLDTAILPLGDGVALSYKGCDKN